MLPIEPTLLFFEVVHIDALREFIILQLLIWFQVIFAKSFLLNGNENSNAFIRESGGKSYQAMTSLHRMA